MTNGTVKADKSAGGERTLTVGFGKDGTKQIVVPPSAPIVAFEPADTSALKPGAKVFAVVDKAETSLTASSWRSARTA